MGRTREFDRDQALQVSLKLFWQNGYSKTSLDDLLKEMGIQNSSFYQAFGSKESLFVEVMTRYRQSIGAERLEILSSEKGSARVILRRYYDHLINKASARGYPTGCFITSTAATLTEKTPSVAEQVQISIGNVERAFESVLKRAKENREVSAHINTKKTARALLTFTYGITVLSRANKSKKELFATAMVFVDLILAEGSK